MKQALETGVVLDYGHDWARRLAGYAADKGLAGWRAARATHPDGREEYVLVEGTEAAYASPSFEACAAHLDMRAVARQAWGEPGA